MKKKVVLFLMDGLGDLETPKTPLQAGETPNLDELAEEGSVGLLCPLGEGVIPTSDKSHLVLFGYPLEEYYEGRGPMEALGAGFDLKEGDVAFRTNLGTVKEGLIIDRRAGRIKTSLAKKLEDVACMKIEDVEVIYKATVEHRGTLILRGPGLSPEISDTDPHKLNEEVWVSKSKDGKENSKKTARIVNEFSRIIQEKLKKHEVNLGRDLPGNIILLRGAGKFRKVASMEKRFGLKGACVSGGALYKGVAKYVGMDILEVEGATGDKNTDLKAKGNAVLDALKNHDFVFLHVKATDSFGHDGNFEGKKKMIERIDKELIPLLTESGAVLVISGDHSSPVSHKGHSSDYVPLVVYGWEKDSVSKFDEKSCKEGKIGKIYGKDLIKLILKIVGE